ncbi:MAG TPA: hypothetical protein VLL25_03155 [Acidimicrobiales bacterium]|nr:hypothetical protein [Acidimicrobiales bacterium]
MGVSASLQNNELEVPPGSEVTTDLRVRNSGSVVDQFTFQPLGAASGWMEVDPPTVSLFPGAEETARLKFRPPKAPTSAAGPTPFAVRVLSREDPEGSVVEEGTITVEAFDDRSMEILPKTARGRRSARFDLAFDNKGNVRAAPRLGGIDPEEELRFDFSPPALNVAAGAAQFSRLKARPSKRFWKGPPKTHPFQVVAEEDGKEPLVTDASMLQEAVLPPWFWTAVALTAAAIIALVILWFTVFKPTIKSTAKDAVKAPVTDLNKRLDAAGIPPVGTTTTTKPGGGAGSGSGAGTSSGGTGTSGGGTGTSGGGALSGTPTDFRVAPGNAPPAGTDTASHAIPAGQAFSLTDLVLENPNGDTGTITIMRGAETLFSSALQNFRDLDFHFVAPYVFTGPNSFTVVVTCTTPGSGAPRCTPAVSAAGFQRAT